MSEFLLFHGVAIVILILANGFFVAAEFALVSVRSFGEGCEREQHET